MVNTDKVLQTESVAKKILKDRKEKIRRTRWKNIKKHWQLYLIIIVPLVFIFVFNIFPMAGAVIAFKDYSVSKGIFGSDWVGLKHFESFILGPNFSKLLKNTLVISGYQLVLLTTIPIALALALNEIQNEKVKKFVQTLTFAPYFISTVVLVSIIILILSPNGGFMNTIFDFFGKVPPNLMGSASAFKHIFVWSSVWQQAGYSAVIYLAALSGIDPQLYEAAEIDGASRFEKIRNIDIPGIMPIIIVLLVLNIGQVMALGYEKIYLLQNNLNLSSSEVISTYVYKMGVIGANYSFATAVGLFNSVVNVILMVSANKIVQKFTSQESVW